MLTLCSSLLFTGDPCQPSDPGASPGHAQPVPVKRGPGRPRLRPVGPGHQGTRGPPRPRKAPKPLPVPLRSGCATPSSASAVPSAAATVEQPRPFGFYTQDAGPTEWAGNAAVCCWCPYRILSVRGFLTFFVPWAPLTAWRNLRTPFQENVFKCIKWNTYISSLCVCVCDCVRQRQPVMLKHTFQNAQK